MFHMISFPIMLEMIMRGIGPKLFVAGLLTARNPTGGLKYHFSCELSIASGSYFVERYFTVYH